MIKMSVVAIRTKLLAKLNEMQSLKIAFEYEASNPDGKYPFATLTLRAGEGDFRSTAHNLRMRSFWVRLYQERTKVGQGSEAAERIVAEVIDELEKAFDMDTTLSGTCKYVTPVEWDASYVVRGENARLLQIQVNATDLVSSA